MSSSRIGRAISQPLGIALVDLLALIRDLRTYDKSSIMCSMIIPTPSTGIRLAVEQLAQILDTPDLAEGARYEVLTDGGHVLDAVVTARGHTFVLEWSRCGNSANVTAKIQQLATYLSRLPADSISILVVPFMPEGGRRRCSDAQMNWLDLSGNSTIVSSNFFYKNLGHQNRFPRLGRPATVFGARGSRLARRLLMDHSTPLSQRTLALLSGVNEGHVSRLVGKLIELGLIERGAEGIGVLDPDALLDAWVDDYRFDMHHITRGEIPGLGEEDLVRFIAEVLSKAGQSYAMTGLAGVWQWTHRYPSDLATVYIAERPSEELKRALGFRESRNDAVNCWLVTPTDFGVFDDTGLVNGIVCANPLQLYLDLKGLPEPATDAAAEIWKFLPWRRSNEV